VTIIEGYARTERVITGAGIEGVVCTTCSHAAWMR
jgi:hypothetical protein